MPDNELALELETLVNHVCCYEEKEVQDLLDRVRKEAVLDTAAHFRSANSWLGGETYPEDIEEYATEKYGKDNT